MKNILLISNYYHLKTEKEICRYRVLAEMLTKNKNVFLEIVTSKFYQRTLQMRNISEEYIKTLPYKFTTIFEPGYKRTISIKRLVSSHIFARNVLNYVKNLNSIDLIYMVVPTLDVSYVITKYAKKKNIPVIIDVQDLWPEAFRMAFNIPLLSSLLFFPYKYKANYIYSNSTDVCAVSKTYLERALSVRKDSKDSIGHAVFIGVNLSDIDDYCAKQEIVANNKLTIAYCGSLGNSYDLELVIKALQMVDLPIKFLVMGDGEKRQSLELLANECNVDVEFTGFINYQEMCRKLRESDIVINPIKGNAPQSIINKHGDYVASGKPILNTQNCKEFIDLIDEYHMGLNSPSGDVSKLAQNILYLAKNSNERLLMGKNARKCAEEKFDRKRTYQELVDVIYKYVNVTN